MRGLKLLKTDLIFLYAENERTLPGKKYHLPEWNKLGPRRALFCTGGNKVNATLKDYLKAAILCIQKYCVMTTERSLFIDLYEKYRIVEISYLTRLSKS